MKIYIINLKSATKRKEFQQQQCQTLGLNNYEFFNALTPKSISEAIYQKYYYDWQRPLRKAEVACYLSHQTLWKKIIKDNQPALILEDDILLAKNTAQLLKEFDEQTDFELINLENFMRKKYISKHSKKIKNTNYSIYRLYLDKAGAAAYVLYPNGAKKLIQCEQKQGIALADAHIHNCHQLKSYQVEPTPAIQMMFAKYYDIEKHADNISISSINHQNKPKSNINFKIKRIIAQLKLGLYQISIRKKSNKRYITLNNKDFL